MSDMPNEMWVSYAEDGSYYSASAATTQTHDDMVRFIRADRLAAEAKGLADELETERDENGPWVDYVNVDLNLVLRLLAFLRRLSQ